MWVDRLLSAGQVFRDLSLGLSCPFHCGGSIALPFLSGLSIGLVLGIFLSVTFALCFVLHSPGLVRPSPPTAPSASSILRRRLSGYVVHE